MLKKVMFNDCFEKSQGGLKIPDILKMPCREAGDPVKGRSHNVALVTNTRLCVQVVLYLELKPARGRIGAHP